MDKLDEKAARKPGFLGGEPIEMADNQVYFLPKPMLEFFPKIAEDGTVSAGTCTSLGAEFDRAIERYDAVCEQQQEGGSVSPGNGPMDAAMALAVVMLRINYDLDAPALASLLRWRPDDEASDERWGSILNVARGLAPKPKADGENSPS